MKSKQPKDTEYLGNLPVRSVILTADIACLAAHITFLIVFSILDITEMVYFNIFSVTFYAVLIPLICRFSQYYSQFISAALIEVVIHSAAATLCIGWWSGFTMFIVCIIPIPFFLNFKHRAVTYISSAACVAVFLALKIYSENSAHVIYQLEDNSVQEQLYLFNSLISFGLIIGVAIIYRESHDFSQQQLTEQNEKLSKLATIDPLSQLFNRRAMMAYLGKIHEKSIENDTTYVIAMGDIDDFKKINDTYGHSVGDEVIREISKIMVEKVPAEGYVCRWGGEELLFAIPSADEAKGTEVAELIRSELEGRKFESPVGSFGVTITFGVCESDSGTSYEKIISNADQCLYYGKEHGKNQVINVLARTGRGGRR